MVTQLIEDEFGLFHADVRHPRAPRAVQLMVLKAESGWWAYIDGDRIDATFSSRQHAAQAATKIVARLPAPVSHTAQPVSVEPFVTHRPKRRVAAVAAYVLLMAVTGGAAIHALGGFDDRSNTASAVAVQDTHVFAQETRTYRVAALDVAVPAQRMRDIVASLENIKLASDVLRQPTAAVSIKSPIAGSVRVASTEAGSTPLPTPKPSFAAERQDITPLPVKNTFRTSNSIIQLVSVEQAEDYVSVKPETNNQPLPSGEVTEYAPPRRANKARRRIKKVTRAAHLMKPRIRSARRLAKLRRTRRGLGYSARRKSRRRSVRARLHNGKAYRKAYARQE